MALRFAKFLLILPAFSLFSFAADPDRPLCNAKNLGLLWPQQANNDPQLMGKLARCGELTMCTRRKWKYRWDSPVVTLDQLRHRQVSNIKRQCDVDPAGLRSEAGQ